jgi:hypothetical protein
MALSALPAAASCFCLALLLAVIAGSDPGAVYEQHRWLGAVVAVGAGCAFAAMMGWATARHGGVPAPVLLMALVVAGVPFALPGGLFLPGAALAVAACAVLATTGLARPPASLQRLRRLSGGLALAALALTIGQALVVGLHERPGRPRAAVESSRTVPHNVAAAPAPAAEGPAPPATAPPPTALPSSPRRFVRDYYAALDARRFAAAWKLLDPSLQARFGGFAPWRSGYKYTVANSPGSLQVTAAAGAATVGLTLRAGDRDACGKTVERRFAVTWRLARTEAGWRATAAEARTLSGAQPAADC